MSTPICDFVQWYTQSEPARFHMPGHKGVPVLGFEPYDITEIDGADELFTASGIIAESEAQAGALFGAHTIYSTGGSTLCIQTMLHLAARYAVSKGEAPCILAGRNAHKAFINAAALLDIDICWLYPENNDSYISCPITAAQVKSALQNSGKKPVAVYLTSPDYLGNTLDIQAIAEVCHQAGVLLLVDNAHGAYLKFLPRSRHPIDLGADLCCDSAHKTLPVITGGAYLHISYDAPSILAQQAKVSMSLFGSSSPSYLILQSLDAANDRMTAFRAALVGFLPEKETLVQRLTGYGYAMTGDEPLKITLCPKPFGYTGVHIAEILEENGIYPEFYDPDHVVLMLSPENSAGSLRHLEKTLCSLKRSDPITELPPCVPRPDMEIKPHQALLSESETLPIEDCLGRISAAAAISCPPAIPLAVCGERIDQHVVDCLRYYGVAGCAVIKE